MYRLTYPSWTVLYKVITGFSISLLIAVNATAQDLISEEQLLGEIPVVISASRLSHPVTEAPAAVTIIDREMIEASGARRLADVFRLVPGFVAANFNGHRAIIAPYGMADAFSRRLQILIDGRSVYKPDFGGVTWSDLPLALEDIDKIEVIRGPNAVTYGANSYLGVINIITKSAAAIRGTHIKYTTGQQDTSDTLLQYGSVGKDLDYRLTLSRQKDTGFDDINDGRRASFFNGRFDYRASNNDTINFKLGVIGGELGEGKEGDIIDLLREEKINSHFQHILWTHLSDTTGKYSLQYYHNYHESLDAYSMDLTVIHPALGPDPVTLPDLLVDYNVISERHDVEFQHTLGFDNYLRLNWGFSARRDTVSAERIFNTATELKNDLHRIFVNTEWRLSENLLIHAGTLLEDTTITDKEASSRLAVNYHVTPGHTLRTSYSTATRNPTLLEEKADARYCVIGLDPTCSQTVTLPAPYDILPPVSSYIVTERSSGGLVPEEIDTWDIGYMVQLSDALYFDIRISRSNIEKLIDWDNEATVPDNIIPTLRIRDYVTRDVTDSLGTQELQLSYSPGNNDRILLSFAHLDMDSGKYLNERAYTSSVPKKVGSLLVTHDFKDGFKGSMGYYFLDELKHLDSEDQGSNKLEARKQLDLKLSRVFHIGSSEAEFSGVIQNTLNDYKEYHGHTVVSTQYYMNFSLKLN